MLANLSAAMVARMTGEEALVLRVVGHSIWSRGGHRGPFGDPALGGPGKGPGRGPTRFAPIVSPVDPPRGPLARSTTLLKASDKEKKAKKEKKKENGGGEVD